MTFMELNKEKQGKIIDKIRKLLALGGSPNEHEAALATSKAHQLLNEYNLSLDELEAKQIQEAKFTMGKNFSKWRINLAHAVSDGFGTKIYLIRGMKYHPAQIVFVGTTVDSEVALYVFEYLNQATEKLIKIFCRTHRRQRRADGVKALAAFGPDVKLPRFKAPANSYAFGIVKTLREKIEEFCRKPEVVMAEPTTGLELIALKDKAIDLFLKEKLEGSEGEGYNSGANDLDPNAFAKGRKDGQDVSIHRGVSGSTKYPTNNALPGVA